MNMMNEQHIFDLAAEHEANRNGLYGPVTFDSTGLVEFARAIEAEVASRYLASTAVEQAEPAQDEETVRFCPHCGSIGEVEATFRDCCPDGSAARYIPRKMVEVCRDTFKLATSNASYAAPAAPEHVQATGKLHELKTDPAVFAAVLAATSAAAPAAPEQDLDRLRRSQPAAHIATDLDGHGDVGMTIEQAKYRAGENCDTIIALHDISVDFVEHEGRPQVRDEVRNQALEEVAKLIDKKVESYCNEHGSYDHTTGVTEYPGDGAEWVCEMEELAEEIRAMKTATNEGDA